MRLRALLSAVSVMALFCAQAAHAAPRTEALAHYGRLLDSVHWRQEAYQRGDVWLRDHLQPVNSSLRVVSALAGAHSMAVGFASSSLNLLELAAAYDVMACGTAGLILEDAAARGAGDVPARLAEFAAALRTADGDEAGRAAERLFASLQRLTDAIDRFEYQRDLPSFEAREVGERLMQSATGVHKAKGTLKLIALSAAQCAAALHTQYMLEKGLAEQVVMIEDGRRDVPFAARRAVEADWPTYVLVELRAADQWDTISFALSAGPAAPSSRGRLRGNQAASAALVVPAGGQFDVRLFNGVNWQNTNLLQNRCSVRVSCLRARH